MIKTIATALAIALGVLALDGERHDLVVGGPHSSQLQVCH